MAAPRGNAQAVVTIEQVNNSLNEIIQNNNNISEYKKSVLKAIAEYLEEVSRKKNIINPLHLLSIINIFGKINDFDPVFLKYVIDQTLAIEDLNNTFRNKVGQVALNEISNFYAGACELLLAMPILYMTMKTVSGADSLLPWNALALLACISMLLIIDHLHHTFAASLKKNPFLPASLHEISQDIAGITLKDAVSIPFQLGNKTLGDIAENSLTMANNVRRSAHYIASNTRRSAYSYFLLFRSREQNPAQPNNAANPPQIPNPPPPAALAQPNPDPVVPVVVAAPPPAAPRPALFIPKAVLRQLKAVSSTIGYRKPKL